MLQSPWMRWTNHARADADPGQTKVHARGEQIVTNSKQTEIRYQRKEPTVEKIVI